MAEQTNIIAIIRDYVLQNLADKGEIPYRITKGQHTAATKAVAECLRSASQNRDSSPRTIQRETTLLAIQTIPRAIAEASQPPKPEETRSTPRGEPAGSPQDGSQPPSIDDLVEQEMARRRDQDALVGAVPPPSSQLNQPGPIPQQQSVPGMVPPTPSRIPKDEPSTSSSIHPVSLPQAPPPVPAVPPIQHETASHPAQPIQPVQLAGYETIVLPHNPEEASPIRIRYTPRTSPMGVSGYIDRLVLPHWVRGDHPFILCRAGGNTIYMVPSPEDSSILVARPHRPIQLNGSTLVVTLHAPDGEPLTLDLVSKGLVRIHRREASEGSTPTDSIDFSTNHSIRGLTGLRVRHAGNTEYSQRIYSISAYRDDTIEIPLAENEAAIESILGNLGSPWAVSLFLLIQYSTQA